MDGTDNELLLLLRPRTTDDDDDDEMTYADKYFLKYLSTLLSLQIQMFYLSEEHRNKILRKANTLWSISNTFLFYYITVL